MARFEFCQNMPRPESRRKVGREFSETTKRFWPLRQLSVSSTNSNPRQELTNLPALLWASLPISTLEHPMQASGGPASEADCNSILSMFPDAPGNGYTDYIKTIPHSSTDEDAGNEAWGTLWRTSEVYRKLGVKRQYSFLAAPMAGLGGDEGSLTLGRYLFLARQSLRFELMLEVRPRAVTKVGTYYHPVWEVPHLTIPTLTAPPQEVLSELILPALGEVLYTVSRLHTGIDDGMPHEINCCEVRMILGSTVLATLNNHFRFMTEARLINPEVAETLKIRLDLANRVADDFLAMYSRSSAETPAEFIQEAQPFLSRWAKMVSALDASDSKTKPFGLVRGGRVPEDMERSDYDRWRATESIMLLKSRRFENKFHKTKLAAESTSFYAAIQHLWDTTYGIEAVFEYSENSDWGTFASAGPSQKSSVPVPSLVNHQAWIVFGRLFEGEVGSWTIPSPARNRKDVMTPYRYLRSTPLLGEI